MSIQITPEVTLHGASLRRQNFQDYRMVITEEMETSRGFAWTANLFRGDALIGTAEQTGRGAGSTVDFQNSEISKTFTQFAEELYPEYPSVIAMEMILDDMNEEAAVLQALTQTRKENKLPAILKDELESLSLSERSAVTEWSFVPGGVADPSRVDAPAGAHYFDGTEWVPFG